LHATRRPVTVASLSSAGPSGLDREAVRRRAVALAVAVGLFGFAFALSIGVTRLADAVVGIGEPGTLSRLVTDIAGLHVLGFGIGTAVVLLVLSTFVAVPMEEVFFRGTLQRRLEEIFHPAVAILAASLLFTLVHASITVSSGGELLAFGLFFSFGLALGTSYHLTENLLVPLTGHVMYNGVQIVVQLARLVS
jgi:membrane protease YdiL (CAAX protease family)